MFFKKDKYDMNNPNSYSILMLRGSQAGGIAFIVCGAIALAICIIVVCVIAVSLGLIVNFTQPKSKAPNKNNDNNSLTTTVQDPTINAGMPYPQDSCGIVEVSSDQRILAKRIINGNIVDSPFSWPWMVSLRGNGGMGHRCGGVIVIMSIKFYFISITRSTYYIFFAIA
jgi:hypothetical protein